MPSVATEPKGGRAIPPQDKKGDFLPITWMKYKLPLVLFVLILSGLVFFSLFQSLHMGHVFRLETSPFNLLHSEDTRSEVVINFRLTNPAQSPLPQPEVLEYAREIANKDDVTVILSGSEISDKNITKMNFILGDDFNLDPLVGDSLSWTDPNESRYLAVGHSENPIHILSNNYRRFDLVLRPWNQIEEHFTSTLGLYSIFIYTHNDPNRYLEDPKLYSFNDPAYREEAYVNSIEELRHVRQGDFYSSRSSWITISMIGLLIVFVYFLFVANHAKEIAVRHLNGQSNFQILHKLFSPFNMMLFSAWLLPMIILSLTIGTGWNPLAIAFYKQLLNVTIVFFLGLILASLIALLYIKRSGFHALKQSGQHTTTSSAMYGVKLVFLILCVAFLSTFWQNIQGYQEVKRHLDIYGDKPIYEVMLASGAQSHEIDYDKLREAIADYAMYFRTIQVVDRNKPVMGERPTFLFQTVMADPQLVNYADIILPDGTVFVPEPGKKYLLYPPGTDTKAYFQAPEINQSPEGVELVEIRAEQDLLLPHEFGAVYNNYAGFSFFLSEDIKSNQLRDYIIDRRAHPWEEVSDHLEASGFPRWSVLPMYRNAGGHIEEMQFSIQMDERNIVVAGISLMIAILITYSFTRIYIDDHRKRLAVSYLFGESLLKRYSYLFGAWLLIYIGLSLFFVVFQNLAIALLKLNYSPNLMARFSYDLNSILKAILAFFVAEGLLSLYFIHRLEIGLVRALKGGEL